MRFTAMPPTSIRSLGVIATAALVLVATTGCGGDSKAAEVQKSADYLTCIGNLEHTQTTAVLRRLISKGQFTRAEIANRFPSSMPQSSYLQTDGNLRPFAKLPVDAQTAVIDWIGALEAHGGLGMQLTAAEARADIAAKTACQPS